MQKASPKWVAGAYRRLFFGLHAAKASTHAEPAFRQIAGLYRIEAEIKGLDPPQRLARRQSDARPVLNEVERWIDQVSANVSPNSLAKALAHTRKRWPALVRYVDDASLPIDNNPDERSIRPSAVSRKNWLFTGMDRPV